MWYLLRLQLKNDGIKSNLLTEADTFDLEAGKKIGVLYKGMMAYAFCQAPIIYSKIDVKLINVHYYNGSIEKVEGHQLSGSLSNKIFNRSEEIEQIEVGF